MEQDSKRIEVQGIKRTSEQDKKGTREIEQEGKRENKSVEDWESEGKKEQNTSIKVETNKVQWIGRTRKGGYKTAEHWENKRTRR